MRLTHLCCRFRVPEPVRQVRAPWGWVWHWSLATCSSTLPPACRVRGQGTLSRGYHAGELGRAAAGPTVEVGRGRGLIPVPQPAMPTLHAGPHSLSELSSGQGSPLRARGRSGPLARRPLHTGRLSARAAHVGTPGHGHSWHTAPNLPLCPKVSPWLKMKSACVPKETALSVRCQGPAGEPRRSLMSYEPAGRSQARGSQCWLPWAAATWKQWRLPWARQGHGEQAFHHSNHSLCRGRVGPTACAGAGQRGQAGPTACAGLS